jgi:hypothetical protein
MAVEICWICKKDVATTGEHNTKRTDIRGVFGDVSQSSPLRLTSATKKNRPVGSLDSKYLKSPSLICANCNNAHTQPYDRAWEKLSPWLRIKLEGSTAGAIVRANRIFPTDTRRMMRNVQLYFVKQFGLKIKEANMPIDLSTFASAICNGKAHPNVYLKFGYGPTLQNQKIVGASDVNTVNDANGRCVFATWLYQVDRLAVMVMFAADGQKREGLKGAWHPRCGTNKLILYDFT